MTYGYDFKQKQTQKFPRVPTNVIWHWSWRYKTISHIDCTSDHHQLQLQSARHPTTTEFKAVMALFSPLHTPSSNSNRSFAQDTSYDHDRRRSTTSPARLSVVVESWTKCEVCACRLQDLNSWQQRQAVALNRGAVWIVTTCLPLWVPLCDRDRVSQTVRAHL